MFLASAPLAATVDQLRTNQLDVQTHIRAMCERIDAIDPEIQAWLPEPNRFERLLTEARHLEQRYPQPEDRPPLYGALVGVKDIFRVDGFATRAGSQLPAEEFAGAEAACVTRLKNAGALILGKTVTTEFAYFEPGPTRNPHNLNHTPGGSSSGSAAAVAAGMCQLALGTQTIGSVIRPAAFCGILGFKPSFDRVLTDGLIIFSRSADHVGFFTQDMAGMRLTASVLCDGWHAPPDTRAALPVLGIPTGPYLQQATAEALEVFDAQVARLERQGCVITRVPAFEQIEALNHRHRELTAIEAAREHVRWFDLYEDLYRPKTHDIIVHGNTISEDAYAEYRASQTQLRQYLAELQQTFEIDAWICPAAPGDAPDGLASTGSPIMNLPWTHAGLPAVTIPAGVSQRGLPLGCQLVGAFRQDEQLLEWAGDVQNFLISASAD